MLGVPTMNNSSLEFSPFNWLSLVPGIEPTFRAEIHNSRRYKLSKELTL